LEEFFERRFRRLTSRPDPLELEKGIPASLNHLLVIEEASAPFDLHEWSFWQGHHPPYPRQKLPEGKGN
jgi:hypothetical protein